jgi:hypothetical protein
MNQKKKISILIIIALVIGAVMILRQKSSPTITNIEVETESSDKHAGHDHDAHEDFKAQKPVMVQPERTEPVELSVAMKQLPTIRDMEGLTDEDVHHTPDSVVEGGMLIGELLEQADKNPAVREETLKFLKSCAENAELMPAIRAVCWKRTLDQIPQWKIFLPISDADVPDDIKVLSSKIP